MGDVDQRFGGSWNAHKNWKKLREKHRKHKASGKGGTSEPVAWVPYSGGAGKGDKDRTRNQSKYNLGMDLIQIAKDKGKDSKEYQEALVAWRNS